VISKQEPVSQESEVGQNRVRRPILTPVETGGQRDVFIQELDPGLHRDDSRDIAQGLWFLFLLLLITEY
jgi:hypothetical protein